jgi:hypothetical protein
LPGPKGRLDKVNGGGAEVADVLLQRGSGSSAGRIVEEDAVLYTFAVVLLILWLLGMVSGYTIGAFIHVLLVIAIVLLLVQLISGRRPAL